MASREKGRRTMLHKHAKFILGAVIGLAPVAFCPPALAQYISPTTLELPFQGTTVPKAVFTVNNISADTMGVHLLDPPSGCKAKYPKSIQPHKKASISITCPFGQAVEKRI
jgi:hypothetical protein